jgi:ABC-2 type transport system permease protein
VSLLASATLTALFVLACLATVWWIFRTGYRIKN